MKRIYSVDYIPSTDIDFSDASAPIENCDDFPKNIKFCQEISQSNKFFLRMKLLAEYGINSESIVRAYDFLNGIRFPVCATLTDVSSIGCYFRYVIIPWACLTKTE